MKKAGFLHKLHHRKKLVMVEPSEEIKDAYLLRSAESLSSAKTLLRAGNLKDAVALAYYAMYHALLALLFRVGIKCENHTAAILLMKEVFGLDDQEISNAKSERVDQQYYVDFKVTKEEVSQAVIIAEEFIGQLNDYLARLTEKDIEGYRRRADQLMKA